MDDELRATALDGDFAALSLALENGADPRLRDGDGFGVLHCAVMNFQPYYSWSYGPTTRGV